MKFQYTSTASTNIKGRLTKRPMLEVEVIHGENTIDGLGLIDSGADTTMMNIEYAKALGIDLQKSRKKEFIGIGKESVDCYIYNVQLKVKKLEHTITTPVAFTDSQSVNILLGQEDFFECFRIKFEKDHDVFEVTVPRR